MSATYAGKTPKVHRVMGRGLALSAMTLSLWARAQAVPGQEPAALANWTSPPYWASALPPAPPAPAGDGLEASSEAILGGSAPALPFFTLAPCRVADTRGNGFTGPFGLPFMPGGAPRDFPIAGQCGIPAGAKAVSFNFTVTDTAGPGFLAVYPQGTPYPGISTLNYLGGQTVANAAVVPLGASGAITVVAGVSGFDVIIDVNGYYAPSGIVSSLNALTGDVTLLAGSNITVTPSGNTLTIAAALTNLNAGNVTSGVLGLSFGGTGSTSALGARLNLGAAGLGANSDITSLAGLTTPLSVAQGGTGSSTPFVSAFQARVTGTCPAGSFLVSVASNGTVGCGAPVADPRPGFARSTVDGAGDVGSDNSVAIGADGLALISYSDSTHSALKVAHCQNTACTSAATATLDAGGYGWVTSIAIGADGLGLISYFTSAGDLKVAHCNDAACATATVALLESTLSIGPGVTTSVSIGTDGLGLIAYYHSRNADLKVAHCANAACSSATTSTLDSPGDVGSSASLTIGADGLGLISYYDATNQDLKVAHCNDAPCSGAATATLDSAGLVGGSTSITIGEDGLGLISYQDLSNGDLKAAHCANIACSNAALATLDSAGNVGAYTSITIGNDGLGLISYQDGGNLRLKVAHCSNTACSAAATATVESSVMASVSAITIGADGLGLLSYWDATNRDLKVLHCGNALCTPFVRRR